MLLALLPAVLRAQTVTLSGGQVSVEQAVEAIKQQAGYRISYNKNLFDPARRIAVNGGGMGLHELLDAMVANTDAKYMVYGQYVAFVPHGKSQPVAAAPEPTTIPEPELAPPITMNLPPPAPVVELANIEFVPTALPPPIEEMREWPRFAIKSNLLYVALWMTPNLSAEVALSPHSTVALSYSNNPWNWKRRTREDNKKLLHGVVSPEYRYWFGERFAGHFVGLHALYSEFNVSGRTVPTLFEKEYRYSGSGFGAGLSYGYVLTLARHLSVEFTAGVGVARLEYDRFSCRTCDRLSERIEGTWFGPTRLGINLVYNFGHTPVVRKATALAVIPQPVPPQPLPPPPPPVIAPVVPAKPVAIQAAPEVEPEPVSVAETLSEAFPFVQEADEKMEPNKDGVSVYFHRGSHTIDMDFMDNGYTLENLEATANMITASPNSRVVRIVITGAASPEGELDDNELLSLLRAVAVKKFLLENTSLAEDQILTYRSTPPDYAPPAEYPYLRTATYITLYYENTHNN
jgi:outer membrane protein OmpA-like peptidoglycan-associated protein